MSDFKIECQDKTRAFIKQILKESKVNDLTIEYGFRTRHFSEYISLCLLILDKVFEVYRDFLYEEVDKIEESILDIKEEINLCLTREDLDGFEKLNKYYTSEEKEAYFTLTVVRSKNIDAEVRERLLNRLIDFKITLFTFGSGAYSVHKVCLHGVANDSFGFTILSFKIERGSKDENISKVNSSKTSFTNLKTLYLDQPVNNKGD